MRSWLLGVVAIAMIVAGALWPDPWSAWERRTTLALVVGGLGLSLVALVLAIRARSTAGIVVSSVPFALLVLYGLVVLSFEFGQVNS